MLSRQRLITREIRIGNLLLGNGHPIRVQTMTTTDTMDTAATVAQTLRCIEAGAELVRITAPSKKEAENLQHIKDAVRAAGYDTPLVADIHFTPNAAEIAARIIEKVRVNPGNYVDKKKFDIIEYTDAEYQAEIDRIRERFTPLVRICKEYGTAMRIGTNHGSLSDRIMSRYGDTPIGMVESAMEFLRIARDEQYHNIVLSMKSSNPQVMVQAYRLLVQQMQGEFSECYPLHLGVTEAGDGEDGRIKSAIGIGSLLEEGIGDTIRVSLTEDPEFEIPVCRDIVKRYSPTPALPKREGNAAEQPTVDTGLSHNTLPLSREEGDIVQERVIKNEPFHYASPSQGGRRREALGPVPVVVADFGDTASLRHEDLQSVGYTYDAATDKWHIGDAAADYLYTGPQLPDFALPGTLRVICRYDVWLRASDKTQCFPLLSLRQYFGEAFKADGLHFVLADAHAPEDELQQLTAVLQKNTAAVLVLYSSHPLPMASVRRYLAELQDKGVRCPVILKTASQATSIDEQLIHYATETGGLLLDGFGEGIWLRSHATISNIQVTGRTYLEVKNIHQFLNNTAFSILQATRTRISKTEYISCPSCGRTLFDLQETTAKIRAATNHLKGVKIAIMGCIVNGPGEMADADFGYVGSGPGKITLYKGKEVVKRNVDSDIAVQELIGLLKENEAWVEPA